MDNELQQYNRYRLKRQQSLAVSLIMWAISIALYVTATAVEGYVVVSLLVLFQIFMIASAQAMEYDGIWRRVLKPIKGPYHYPPLSEWEKELIAKGAFEFAEEYNE